MLNLIISIFAFLVFPKNVILHLEKIPKGITHTGVSFKTLFKTRRYDFRAFNENKTCMTTGLDRQDPKIVFPDIYEEGFDLKTKESFENFFKEKPELIKLDINLGTTLRTFAVMRTAGQFGTPITISAAYAGTIKQAAAHARIIFLK